MYLRMPLKLTKEEKALQGHSSFQRVASVFPEENSLSGFKNKIRRIQKVKNT